MSEVLKGAARKLEPFSDAESALQRVSEIYDAGTAALRERFDRFLADGSAGAEETPCYPYVGIVIDAADVKRGGELSYG